MLKTNVIVRNVKNLHDARYCAGMGVEYISMPISNELKNSLTIEQINEIADWLSGIKIVGFVGETLIEDVSNYESEIIETSDFQKVKSYNSPILTLEITPDQLKNSSFKNILEQVKSETSFFVLVCKGKFTDYDADLIKDLIEHYSIYWGFNFDPEDMLDFIDNFEPEGIALNGTEEIKTGLNNFDDLADLLEALDTDEYV